MESKQFSVAPLTQDDYYVVTKHTQVISVDLILRNSQQGVLLGRRKNAPAKGMWVVPGGRVFKHETIPEAIKRISKVELGVVLPKSNMEFVGAYDHIYPDNFRDGTHATHYLAHGFATVANENEIRPEVFAEQHDEMAWMSVRNLLDNKDVHEYTKNYFRLSKRAY